VSERRLSVCLTYDFDTMCVWPTAFGLTSATMLSRGEFGAFALPRILDLMQRHELRGTFFVPGFTALAYPDAVRSIAADGHELGHHGWLHENPSSFDVEGQRQLLVKGIEALDAAAGVRPKGYRVPGAEVTDDAIDLLLELGFAYEATYSATDFVPYFLRKGDVWSPTEPYVFGQVTELVAMPFSYALDDFPHFEFVPGWATNLLPPSAVEEIWRTEFDYAYEASPGGVYILTMHPQVIGRGSRLAMLERLIRHMAGHEGVVFEAMGEYVDRWKAANPVDEWKAANPVLAGTTALGLADLATPAATPAAR
jgi:peptidoglycan/xylan/chitin deacetylase (PgdA/CDA1 family)